MSLNPNEEVYLNLLKDVLENGQRTDDRTGVGTISIFGRQCRYDISDGHFPLFTTKEIKFNSVLSELLWFLEGSTNERRLAEIRYGKPRSELEGKKTIWTANYEDPNWREKQGDDDLGDLGPIYGYQWRSWESRIDQIANLVEGLKRNPYSRRHILTAWNPSDIDYMALPPCHMISQYSVKEGKLSCMVFLRSNDLFLGKPYNVASYALLTMMLAQVTGLKAHELIISIGDAHIYSNHVDQVRELLTREPRESPEVILNRNVSNIDRFTMDDFVLANYDPYPALSAPMAV